VSADRRTTSAGTSPQGDDAPVGLADVPHSAHDTVESVVRTQLSKALGGRRGMLESAVPTIGFTLTFVTTDNLRLALTIGIGAAVVLLLLRLAQRQPVQFVVNSLFGIGIAAVFAMRSGKAEDVFLPGILYNGAYATAMVLSIVTRWPLVGFMIGSVTGDPTGWRKDPAIVRLCSKLTWLLALPCVVRVVVQWPLYLAGQVGWLGVTKIALGWPLQVAALAGMAWVLGRGHTPFERAGADTDEAVDAAAAKADPV
jgi:energy-converting hydrogenase Eha subunit E